jgi:hypothetical protein
MSADDGADLIARRVPKGKVTQSTEDESSEVIDPYGADALEKIRKRNDRIRDITRDIARSS